MILEWYDKQEEEEMVRRVLEAGKETIRRSRISLIVLLRFMDRAISRLRWQMYDGSCAVDGRTVWFDPRFLLLQCQADKKAGARAYLHMVLHCVFRHFDVSLSIDRKLWDLACDIAVECAINDLGIDELNTARSRIQVQEAADIGAHVKKMTAEFIYRWLKETKPGAAELERLHRIFSLDDHELWYIPGKPELLSKKIPAAADYEQGGGDNDEDSENGDGSGSSRGQFTQEREALAREWQEVSRRIRVDMENFSRQYGNKAGSMMQNLKAVTREKYDYTSFLRRFAVPGEAMRISPDEFDMVYYTYGMQLYPERRLPLIEPLEYRDVKRIRDFVIAIDSSGSTAGNLAQLFVQKTYNILKSTENFFTHINLRIFQCDTKIQEEVVINNQQEFDEYIRKMVILGQGGTDFRPVFDRVNELIKEGQFTNLKGLIYFTDGFGPFPDKMPPYQTAFVFVNDEGEVPDIPPWAIKLILTPEEV